MTLQRIFSRFPDLESCIEHLERIRFGNEAYCPLCGVAGECARKADSGRVGRWNCYSCKSSFNVLSGTIFQKTKIPLQLWFLAIGLISNAKKSLSSHQLSRDLGINQKSAWYMQHRIRSEMASKESSLLQGIVEVDETYIGGRPRNKKQNKRGRGTKKTPVIGAVERDGSVLASVAKDLSGKGVMDFLNKSVNPEHSLLITDEYKSYNAASKNFNHTDHITTIRRILLHYSLLKHVGSTTTEKIVICLVPF